MPRDVPPSREDFSYWMLIPTRWSDNDMFSHLNNVAYFRFFEAIIVRFMMEVTKLDWANSPVIPYAAEVLCRFHRPLSFPVTVEAALATTRIGETSVVFRLALFAPDASAPAAVGHFVHVYVERATEIPVPFPEVVRPTFERYLRPPSPSDRSS